MAAQEQENGSFKTVPVREPPTPQIFDMRTSSEQCDVDFLRMFFLCVLIYMQCNLFSVIMPETLGFHLLFSTKQCLWPLSLLPPYSAEVLGTPAWLLAGPGVVARICGPGAAERVITHSPRPLVEVSLEGHLGGLVS